MIVRTYTRRTRDLTQTQTFSDPLTFSPEPNSPEISNHPLSQDSSMDRLKFSNLSSQESCFDPDPTKGSGRVARPTATLMEAQEFGEMMEHVDEVNFAIDGLRNKQPLRIRRASLVSLMKICASAQQRRVLRAQGMAKRIIDAILGLNFDDSPSSIAAATLFFVLASDVQDDHLLDSPPCIQFLLKLLNPSKIENIVGKAPTIGSKLLGIRNPQIPNVTNIGMDSSSRIIISKVHEILLSCKEIKSGSGDDEEMSRRPELSSKWISLLTMEKACLSTVSFEDTSDTMRNARGNFKERLRELGGLDTIFDVVLSCHSTLERRSKCKSPSVSELKDRATLESVVLLLKCLKILENATFLSKDNQDYLLGLKGKRNSEGLSMRFVGVVISSIKFLSGLSLLHCLSNVKHTSQARLKENKRGQISCDGIEGSNMGNESCYKRQKLFSSHSELSDSASEMTVNCSNENNFIKISSLKLKNNANGLKINLNANGLKAISDKPSKHSCGRIPIKTNSCSQSKRQHISEDVQGEGECSTDDHDPFAFDEDECKPTKWDKSVIKEKTPELQITATNKELVRDYDDFSIDMDPILSKSTNGDSQKSSENDCPAVVQEDSNLLEDCLLASVKVLMNLTNDNHVGCQQIADFGGLDTMVSLMVNHFPSYDSCSPLNSQFEDIPSSSQSANTGHLKSKHLTGHGLDFLVAILGLLVNLVEKDSQNRLCLASARVLASGPGASEMIEKHRDVIPFLCTIFLANQGAGEAAGEGKLLLCDDEALMQGEQEAEMMIVEAYAALLLAFLSTESDEVREAIASCLPNDNLETLVPVLERFVAFHLTLNMISPETHSAVTKVIESCKGL